MALVFSTIPTGISMREDGVKTKDMARGPIGWLTQKTNSGGSILEIGRMIQSKGEGPCFIKQEIGMMGCGWITYLMERAE